jgi:hypothetical protein
MEIHGSDICIKSPEIPLSPSLVAILIKDHWPDMVYEFDKSEPQVVNMFIYKDEVAQDLWEKHGWSVVNDTTMIHVMWDSSNPIETWFVIDDIKENQYILEDINKFIRECEHGIIKD